MVALGALTYPISRFAIESLRADELGQFSTSLTISQWISILIFSCGVVFAVWLSRRPKLASPFARQPPERNDSNPDGARRLPLGAAESR